jgi:hypothetical protein
MSITKFCKTAIKLLNKRFPNIPYAPAETHTVTSMQIFPPSNMSYAQDETNRVTSMQIFDRLTCLMPKMKPAELLACKYFRRLTCLISKLKPTVTNMQRFSSCNYNQRNCARGSIMFHFQFSLCGCFHDQLQNRNTSIIQLVNWIYKI